jgi:hypothetical protein
VENTKGQVENQKIFLSIIQEKPRSAHVREERL